MTWVDVFRARFRNLFPVTDPDPGFAIKLYNKSYLYIFSISYFYFLIPDDKSSKTHLHEVYWKDLDHIKVLLLDPYPKRGKPTRIRMRNPAFMRKSVRPVSEWCGLGLWYPEGGEPGLSAQLFHQSPGSRTITYRIYLEYHSVWILVRIGAPPPPLLQASVYPPLPSQPKGGEHTRLRVRGWGSPISDDWTKSWALCLLYAHNPQLFHISCWKYPPYFGIISFSNFYVNLSWLCILHSMEQKIR